jgi:hypothetical protein
MVSASMSVSRVPVLAMAGGTSRCRRSPIESTAASAHNAAPPNQA